MARIQEGVGAGSSFSGSTNSTPVVAPPFTISCWFQSDDIESAQVLGCIQQITGNPDASYWAILFGTGVVDPGGLVFAVIDSTTAGIYAVSTTRAIDFGWHHACAVEASSISHTIYLDGSGNFTETTSSIPANISRLTIGEFHGSIDGPGPPDGFPFNGRISDFAVWNVALTAEEVASLAAGANPYSIRRGSLVFYSPLNALAGNTGDEIDLVGGLILSTSNSVKAESKPGIVRGRNR